MELDKKDLELCDSLAAAIVSEKVTTEGVSGPFIGRLNEVFRRLRESGIPWSKILALVGPILQILLTGGSWEAIIKAILDLFIKPSS